MGNKSQKENIYENNMNATCQVNTLPSQRANSPSQKGDPVQKYSKCESNKSKMNSTFPKLRLIETETQGIYNNMIKMRLIIKKNDVKKPSKILYNIKEKMPDCDIKELNGENAELYINGKQCKYKSYFTPEKEGIYDIQLIIKILMKNCCCLFYGINNLQSLDLSLFNIQNVTNMRFMFYNCYNLEKIDLFSMNTQNITNMEGMFSGCKHLKNIYLSKFDTQNITDMSYMFNNCENLQSLDLSSFNTQNVTNMSYMFCNCNKLKSLNLSSFNTKKVTIMNYMFAQCFNLQSLDLSSFNINNANFMSYMIYDCNNLQILDLSSMISQKSIDLKDTFEGCNKLERVVLNIDEQLIFILFNY